MLFRWLNYIVGILSVRLEGNHNLKQAIDNSGWLLFDKALRMGINLVISVLMARKLGPTQYGQLSYAFSLVALFSPIAALGLEGIVVRNLIMGKDPPSLILGNAIILRLIGSILAIFLSNFTIIWIEPTNSLTRELVLFASLGFIFQCSDVFEMWFQSKVESKYTVKAK